jgi:outer membrane protein W
MDKTGGNLTKHLVTAGLMLIMLLQYPEIYAQADFRKGYIVKVNGDTLTGLVYYGINRKFRKHCRFKRFDLVRQVKYGPENLTAFGFRNGRHFESRTAGNKRIFLECYEKGPVNTYGFPGKPVDPRFTVVDSTAGQGLRAFTRTPPVHPITDYSFIATGSRWTAGITGGMQFLKIDIPGQSSTRYFTEADYPASYRPLAGVTVNRRFSKKNDHFSLDLSVSYLADQYYGYAEYKTLSDCRDDLFLEFSALHVPLSLRYMAGYRGLRPYLKAGFYQSFLLTSHYSRFAERQFGTEIYSDRYSDFKINNDKGFQIGMGLEIPMGTVRKVSIEAWYMQGNQTLTYTGSFYSEPLNTKVKSRTFSILAGINL